MLLVIQSVVAEHNKVSVIEYENSDDFFPHSWKYFCCLRNQEVSQNMKILVYFIFKVTVLPIPKQISIKFKAEIV